MTIKNNSVVSLNYILRDKAGGIVDQSSAEPLVYLHGHRNIIPGLEKALENCAVGDKKKVEVPTADAYGAYDEEKCFSIERKYLPETELEVGMMLELTPEDGDLLIARIVTVEKDHIDVDANHSMAGKDLFFEVEIVAVREATPDELAHGHAHGPGGHHHH